MQNVFDIATPEELMYLFDNAERIADARENLALSPDTHMAYLAFLYDERGDRVKVDECLDAITDEQYRFDTTQLIYESPRPELG